MLKYKKKGLLFVTGLLAMASSLQAEIKVSGSAEADLMYRTNNIATETGSLEAKALQEIAIIVNVDGVHEGNEIFKNFKWRLAQKVATDSRFDAMGIREAWLGGETKFGEVRLGNQFSNFYLMLDWPYGGGGLGNVWADFGAHEAQYGRAITYISPNMSGFTVKAQYDMGDKVADELGKVVSSYAAELVANYDSQRFAVDLGYYMGKNSSSINSEADVFGGNKQDMGSGYGKAENEAYELYLGTILKFNPVTVYLAASQNHWEGKVFGYTSLDPVDSIDVMKAMVKVDYAISEKHSVSVGYQTVLDSKVDYLGVSEDIADGINTYNFQYNYTIFENAVVFTQVRHQTLSTAGHPSLMEGGYQLDGIVIGSDKAKSVTRLLIGAAVSF